MTARSKRAAAPPRVGFVSLGCPKALVDAEQILTQLRAEGYAISPTYDGADLVVVNTCGFIDAAVGESLDAIGEALAENGKVIVTGCLGAKQGGDFVRAAHPKVLAVTGPHATAEVMGAVHAHMDDAPSTTEMVERINNVERALKTQFPEVRWSFFEPDLKPQPAR